MKFELLSLKDFTLFNFNHFFFLFYYTFVTTIKDPEVKFYFYFYFKKFKFFHQFAELQKNLFFKKSFKFWENFFLTFSTNTQIKLSFNERSGAKVKSNLTFLFKSSLKKNHHIFSESVYLKIPNKLTNLTLIFFLFKIFFLFNNSFSNTLFFGNTAFAGYNLVPKGEKILVLNYKSYLHRWLVSYDLLFNLNYFNISKLFFTSPLFYLQNSALNWNDFSWTFELWQWFQHVFIFQSPRHDPKLTYFFSKIKIYGASCAVITDTNYHLKTVFYLKKSYFFTIGLIHVNEDPFFLEYPIVAFFNNYLIQSFFIKFIFFIQKQSNAVKLNYYAHLWQTAKQFYWI